MRKSVLDLVEAVRALGLRRAVVSGEERIRIDIPASEFSGRLLQVLSALEAVDADGALKSGTPAEAELEQMKAGMDQVFRWILRNGLRVEEPLELMAEAMGGKKSKRKKAYEKLPVFAPNGMRKRLSWKPKTEYGGKTLAEHRQRSAELNYVISMMGAAAPARAGDEADVIPASKAP